MKVSYYPGCSLHGTALEYGESTREVCKLLGIELQELPDWNCCGASSAHSTDETLAIALPARNLAKAEEQGLDLVVPCSACFQRFKVAEKHIRESKMPKIDTPYRGRVTIKHLLDFLGEERMRQVIKQKMQKTLNGLKTVCYYGCLTVRPPRITDAADCENPRVMDELMNLLGADNLPWSYKTDCCGGSLMLSRTDIVVRLTGKLLMMADEAGAACIVTACPLCQANLDTRQGEVSRTMGKEMHMSIFYFTELLGLALGSSQVTTWLRRHLVDPRGVLLALGLL